MMAYLMISCDVHVLRYYAYDVWCRLNTFLYCLVRTFYDVFHKICLNVMSYDINMWVKPLDCEIYCQNVKYEILLYSVILKCVFKCNYKYHFKISRSKISYFNVILKCHFLCICEISYQMSSVSLNVMSNFKSPIWRSQQTLTTTTRTTMMTKKQTKLWVRRVLIFS